MRLALLPALFLFCMISFAQRTTAPLPTLKAAIILRIVELERNIAESDRDFTVYVLSAPKVAEALEQYIGQKAGTARFASVERGDELPTKRPDVLFVGTSRNLNAVKKYTRQFKVMSITDRADVFQRGVSVSILTERRRPKISLNSTSSVEEGLNWNLDFRLFQHLVLEFRANEEDL